MTEGERREVVPAFSQALGRGERSLRATDPKRLPADWDGTLSLWDSESGAEVCDFPAPGRPFASAVSPLGERLRCGESGGNVYLLELVGAHGIIYRLPKPAAAGSRATRGSSTAPEPGIACSHGEVIYPPGADWCPACGRDLEAD